MIKFLFYLPLVFLLSCGKTNTYTPEVVSTSPVVYSVSSSTLPENTTETITLTGKNFNSAMKVSIGGQPCVSLSVLNNNTATCEVPALSAGSKTLSVESGNKSSTFSQPIVYVASPSVSSSNLRFPANQASFLLTINGSDFDNASVSIGGQSCVIHSISSSKIECYAPSLSAGAYNLEISNSDGQQTVTTIQSQATPTISSLSSSLVQGLPASININGSGFDSSVSVNISGSNCSSLTFNSSSSLTCLVPNKSNGLYSIYLTNNLGQSASYLSSIRYSTPPYVTATSGVAESNQSASITFSGINLASPLIIKINGSNCSSVVVNNATSATCTVPALASGLYDVYVENQYGANSTSNNLLEYTTPPSISAVDIPLIWDYTTQPMLTIVGSRFLTGATVSINGTACSGVSVINSSTLTCSTPNLSSGFYGITITNSNGQSGTLSNAIRYAKTPTISSVNPVLVEHGSSPVITITGSDFDPTTTFKIGNINCPATYVSSTQMTCQMSSSVSVGIVDVVGTTYGLVGTGSNLITVNSSPSISSISPNVTSTQNVLISITGSDFQSPSTITINGLTCSNPTILSSTSATCIAPNLSAGLYNIVVTNALGQSGTLSNGFRFSSTPSISSVSLSVVESNATHSVTFSGTNFATGDTVSINGTNCSSINIVDSSTLTCTAPALASGEYSAVITNQYGLTSTATNIIRYSASPTITGSTPSIIDTSNPPTITISGTNFTSTSIVDINGSSCLPSTYISATSMQCTLPILTSGIYNIHVTNQYGQVATSFSAIRYDLPPTITAFSGGAVSLGTNPSRIISGTGFDSSSIVKINGVNCLSQTYNSDTSFSCSIPSLSEGLYNITVTNQYGSIGTGSSLVRISAPPTITSIAPTIISIQNSQVTIYGTNFKAGTTFTINGLECSSPNILSLTSATCLAPTLTDGLHSVEATNSYSQSGSLSSAIRFSTPPTLSSMSGGNVETNQSPSRVFTGTGFTPSTIITVGGTTCSNIVINSTTSITCNVPAKSSGSYTARVTNQYGIYTDYSNFVTYASSLPASVISSFSLTNIAITGGETLYVYGTNMNNSVSVTLDSGTCTITHKQSNYLICTTSVQSSVGVKTLTVTNSAGNTATKSISVVDNCSATMQSNSPFASGNGTEGNPFTICTATQYLNINSTTNSSWVYYKLNTNIVLSRAINYSFASIDLNNYTLTGTAGGTITVQKNVQFSNGVILNVDYLIYVQSASFGNINFNNNRVHFGVGSFVWNSASATGYFSGKGTVTSQTCSSVVNFYKTDVIVVNPDVSKVTGKNFFMKGFVQGANALCFDSSILRFTTTPSKTKTTPTTKLLGETVNAFGDPIFVNKSIIVLDEGTIDTSSDNCGGYYCVTDEITETYNRAWDFIFPNLTSNSAGLNANDVYIVVPNTMKTNLVGLQDFFKTGLGYSSLGVGSIPANISVTNAIQGYLNVDGKLVVGNLTGSTATFDWTPASTPLSYYDVLTNDNILDPLETYGDRFFFGSKTSLSNNMSLFQTKMASTPPVNMTGYGAGVFPADKTGFTNSRACNLLYGYTKTYPVLSNGLNDVTQLKQFIGQINKPKDYCYALTGKATGTECNLSIKIPFRVVTPNTSGYMYFEILYPTTQFIFNDIGLYFPDFKSYPSRYNFISYDEFKNQYDMEQLGFDYTNGLIDTNNGYDAPHYSTYPYFYGVSKCAISEINDCTPHP